MRTHPIVSMILTIVLAACGDGAALGTDGTLPDGTPPAGTLLVSTSTSGNAPDLDGYRLTVDGAAGMALEPTGTLAIRLAPGRHALRLLGVAPPCLVASESVLQVDVASSDTVPVGFDIRCSVTGVLVTVATTGVDPDTDGYSVLVDGAARAHVRPNDHALTLLEPGTRTIALTGLEPNCTVDSASRVVTVADTEVVPLAFVVTCTEASGVVGILIQASGPAVYESFKPLLDGQALRAKPERYPGELVAVFPGERRYVRGVGAGDHLVSLAPSPVCAVDTGPQAVTVTAGGSTRDTVDLTFSVTCSVPRANVGTLRISAPTTGSVPPSTRYTIRYGAASYWDYGFGDMALLATIRPDGTAVIEAPASGYDGAGIYWYWFELDGAPSNCDVRSPSTSNPMGFTLEAGETLDLTFAVTCPP